MGRSGREPGASYYRPKGTALQGLGQVRGRSRRGANLREILSRVFQDFPQGRTKPADRTRGRGAHRDPPLPCLSLGTSVLASAGCPSNRCAAPRHPQCPPRCPPCAHSPRRADRILRSRWPARHRRSTDSSLRLLVPPASVAPIGAPAPFRRRQGPGSPPTLSPCVCLCPATGGWMRPRGRSLWRGDTARAWRPDPRDPGHEQVCAVTDTRPLLQRNPCAVRSSRRPWGNPRNLGRA